MHEDELQTKLAPVSELLGQQIIAADGQVIGHVQDLLLDVVLGRIEYVRVALDATDADDLAQMTVPWADIEQRASAAGSLCIVDRVRELGDRARRSG
jgi:sporulation protein YlmC with PRC-barrel domain